MARGVGSSWWSIRLQTPWHGVALTCFSILGFLHLGPHSQPADCARGWQGHRDGPALGEDGVSGGFGQ